MPDLDLTPINTTFDRIRSALARGLGAVAVLEPGDMTRYTFLIVPFLSPAIQGDLRHLGIPEMDARRYFFLADLAGAAFRGSGIIVDVTTLRPWSVADFSTNAHTRDVALSFLRELFSEGEA